MSYGLRELRAQKSSQFVKKITEQVDHLIIGEDLSCLLTLVKLIGAGEKVFLLNSRNLSRAELVNWWEKGIGYIRANEGIGALTSFFPDGSICTPNTPALFYKDHQWKSFGGRSKPAELLSAEDYFLIPTAKVDLKKIFTEDEWNNLDQILSSHLRVQHLSELVPGDDGWLVECKDGSSFQTRKLYWGSDLKMLLDTHSRANDLPQGFHQYVLNMNRYAVLEVYCSSKKKLYEGSETLFIPQSMTHEEGHYIVEFRPYDEVSRTQEFTVLCFVGEDDSQAEDLAKKVRHLKKVMERIFPEMAKSIVDEKVAFHQHFLTQNLGPFDGETGLNHFVILGKEAPLLDVNFSQLQGDWGRSLAAFHQTWM